MMFYIVSHMGDDERRINDKVFLSKKEAIKWGREQATRWYLNEYWLQRCSSEGTVEDYMALPPLYVREELPELPQIIIL